MRMKHGNFLLPDINESQKTLQWQHVDPWEQTSLHQPTEDIKKEDTRPNIVQMTTRVMKSDALVSSPSIKLVGKHIIILL